MDFESKIILIILVLCICLIVILWISCLSISCISLRIVRSQEEDNLHGMNNLETVVVHYEPSNMTTGRASVSIPALARPQELVLNSRTRPQENESRIITNEETE